MKTEASIDIDIDVNNILHALHLCIQFEMMMTTTKRQKQSLKTTIFP